MQSFQQLHLFPGLYKFRNDMKLHRGRKPCDTAHDITRTFIFQNLTNQTAIQLNFIKCIFLQIHHRAVPHAKVIHAHLNSQLLQFPDALQNTSGGTEQGTLRNLKNQLDVMQIDFLTNTALSSCFGDMFTEIDRGVPSFCNFCASLHASFMI